MKIKKTNYFRFTISSILVSSLISLVSTPPKAEAEHCGPLDFTGSCIHENSAEFNDIPSSSPALIPLYLFWNGQGRGDFATVATPGMIRAQRNSGYDGPSVQGCIYDRQVQGTIPLLLFWNGQRKDNATVATPEMIRSQRDSGYGKPAVQGYIFSKQERGTIPLKLFWNGQKEENATVAKETTFQKLQNAGYGNPAIQGYIYPPGRCS